MVDPNNIYHVYPADDIKEHVLKCLNPTDDIPYCPCICNPKIKEVQGTLLILHNAFDGTPFLDFLKGLPRSV